MTGAGLSTPSGIPDFRSPGTGLYDNLQKFNLPYPEAIFDIHYFMMDPKPFFTLAQDLYPGINYKPNIGHYFIYLLHLKNKLQKLYTQNIDGLERVAGIPDFKLVESHGTFFSASCTLCGERHDANMVKDNIISGQTPIICQRNSCKGKVKPDIVFFGENLPEKFWEYEIDVHFSDALLVIGTSLEVYPFAGIADAVSRKIPRILINREIVGSFGERPQDIMISGDLIDVIKDLSNALDWLNELKSLVNS
ncbi:UNVERIFIED_CONTAM: hypothetical protein RMT77_018499 [Armadillidium vulgare]